MISRPRRRDRSAGAQQFPDSRAKRVSIRQAEKTICPPDTPDRMMSAEVTVLPMSGQGNNPDADGPVRVVSSGENDTPVSGSKLPNMPDQDRPPSPAGRSARPLRGRESVRKAQPPVVPGRSTSSTAPLEPRESSTVAPAVPGKAPSTIGQATFPSPALEEPADVSRSAPSGQWPSREVTVDVSKEPATSSPASKDRPVEPASFGMNEPASRPEAIPPSTDQEDSDPPYSATSRLSGLRNLLVSLGIQALNKQTGYVSREPDPDRKPERPMYRGPVDPALKNDAVEDSVQEPVLVKAQPEFLPPRPMVETTERERENEQVRPVPERLRSEAADDVETLPSWRGQYRKRRR